tara:strand:+ start:966 stop:1913 length:948 start_codon:yes stop_codon:yes gene_type:complete
MKNIIRIDHIHNKEINKEINIIRENNIPYALTTNELLKKSCKFHNIDYCGLKKKDIYIKLMNYLDRIKMFNSSITFIIKIQSNWRRYLIKRTSNCVNDTDLLEFESLHLMPLHYFFSITEYDIVYGFDIRFLYKYKKPWKNPYTGLIFSQKSIDAAQLRIDTMIGNGISLILEKDILSPDEHFKLWGESVFHRIDQLDNYTDSLWFFDLSLGQLKKLYRVAEDVWNYRCQFTAQQKINIISTQTVYTTNNNTIQQTINKRWLQTIILTNFEKMVSLGININEKKLGAILVLTALVEVSSGAANSYPYLVQSSNMN